MLNRNDLISTPVDFNLYQKEKDYLQHLILSRIYSNVGMGLVFKGETALQKCFGLNRFSEDLDFTISGSLKLSAVESSLKEVGRFYPSTYSKEESKNTVSYKMKIEGPLFRGPLALQTVRVEISMREEVTLPTLNRIVNPLYIDLQPYSVMVMDPTEILAEKVRALLSRTKARDLYDAYFLLQKKVNLDLSIVAEKLKFYGKTYDPEELYSRVARLKPQWEKTLPSLVRVVPDFQSVIADLKEHLDRFR